MFGQGYPLFADKVAETCNGILGVLYQLLLGLVSDVLDRHS